MERKCFFVTKLKAIFIWIKIGNFAILIFTFWFLIVFFWLSHFRIQHSRLFSHFCILRLLPIFFGLWVLDYLLWNHSNSLNETFHIRYKQFLCFFEVFIDASTGWVLLLFSIESFPYHFRIVFSILRTFVILNHCLVRLSLNFLYWYFI